MHRKAFFNIKPSSSLKREISYLDLTMESDYSLTAVITAVHRLERDGYIILERQGSERCNHYQLPHAIDR